MRTLIDWAVGCLVWMVYRAYKAEGLNALFLLMPARFIAPTLRQYGATIGKDVEMHSPLLIHNASPDAGRHYSKLVIGDDCYFGRDVFFDLKDEIRIQNQVTVSMRVTFITHTDAGKSPVTKRLPPSHAPIKLNDGAYIGAGATILQGVDVGREAIVGAGAVVVHNVPASQMAVGVPARALAGSEPQ